MLGFTKEELESKNGIFTVEEILQQPDTWRKTARQLADMQEPLRSFIHSITEQDDYEIILTGAGTSEYVGNSLLPALLTRFGGHIHSIGTTDIVATPEAFVPADKPLLLVSFARSGNSPESVGAVKAVDRICQKAAHLFITCNRDGALAKMADEKDNCFSLVLTPETHDRSFAMTSSFTNMYLAALIALTEERMDFEDVIGAGEAFAADGFETVKAFVADNDFNRIVYLGSDVLKGIAQEAALKVLELTAGQVVALHDSPMGFRHGPKSVVDEDTVSVVYISENPVTRRYEMDLLKELFRDRRGSKILAVASVIDDIIAANCDLAVPIEAHRGDGSDAAVPNSKLALPYIMAAQVLAVLYALKLGITPDNPCPTGEVNRVVQGVTIYE